MTSYLNVRAVLVAVAAMSLLIACKEGGSVGDDLTGDASLMRFVPADTPYLFATGEPLPDELYDKLEPKLDDALKAYQIAIREIARSALAKNSGDMGPEEMQRTSAVIDELASLMSIEGLRNAGFERDSQAAFYGHGLLPVLRIEVSDVELFDAAIARIEEAAGEKMDVGELDGVSYRYIGDEEASFIIAAFDGNAVMTIVPARFDDSERRILLGMDLPSRNLGQAGTLAEISRTYDFTNHYIGFIDVRRIASTFIDGPTGLDAALFETMENDPADLSAVCKAEIREVVEIAPRVLLGYTEVNAEAMSGSLIVEMRPDIAKGLAGIATMVPGLGADPGGLMSFGASFDLMALRQFYEARLDAMEEDPFECEHFADLQAGVAKGRAALNQPLPPIVYAFRGFNAIVDDIGDFDMASDAPPEDIDASLLIALEDAQTMVAMGAMFSPELAGLNLQPDGKPVLLDLPQLAAIGKAVYAAMLEDAVAVSIGVDAERRVSSVLLASPVEPPPLFSMTMDAGRYYSLIAEAMMVEEEPADGDEDGEEVELSPEARAAMRDAMLAVGSLYDRMAFDVHFTERGLELNSRVTLKD